MLTTSSVKGARNCVDISSKELARYWWKRLKKSKPEIEAAIAKDRQSQVEHQLPQYDCRHE